MGTRKCIALLIVLLISSTYSVAAKEGVKNQRQPLVFDEVSLAVDFGRYSDI